MHAPRRRYTSPVRDGGERHPGAAPDNAVAVEAVRAPTAADAAGLARILPQLSSAPAPDLATLTRIATAEGTTLFLARAGGELVGALTLVVLEIPTGVRGLIEDVVVDEAARGRGVGTALVEHALAAARAAGAGNVDLTSRPSRIAANRLYERTGFTRRETNVWRYRFG